MAWQHGQDDFCLLKTLFRSAVLWLLLRCEKRLWLRRHFQIRKAELALAVATEPFEFELVFGFDVGVTTSRWGHLERTLRLVSELAQQGTTAV